MYGVLSLAHVAASSREAGALHESARVVVSTGLVTDIADMPAVFVRALSQ